MTSRWEALMKITVLRPGELGPAELALWSEIQDANPLLKSPYFNAEFTRLAGEVRADARVGVIEEGHRIKGFFPFQKRAGGVALPIAGPFTDWEGLVIPSGFEPSLADVLRGCGLCGYDFENVPLQPSFRSYVHGHQGSHALDISQGFDAYIAQRRNSGSLTFNMTQTKRRRLDRQTANVRFVYDDRDPRTFALMKEWKSRQYRESRHIDAFQFSWASEILERVLNERGENFSGLMSSLYADDQLIAVHVGMRSRNVLHYWFPAYNGDYAKFSPGLILFYEMVRAAAQNGIEIIDLGKGSYEFKQNVATIQIPLLEGSVSLPSLRTTLRKVESWGTRSFEALPLGVVSTFPRRGLRRLRRELAFR